MFIQVFIKKRNFYLIFSFYWFFILVYRIIEFIFTQKIQPHSLPFASIFSKSEKVMIYFKEFINSILNK